MILDGTIIGQEEKCSDEKISIVRLLNENPQLSHDRLVMVLQVQGGSSSNVTLNVRDSTNTHAMMISLFGDYGFKFEGSIKYGRVHRMRSKGKRQGFVEYEKPLLYTDQYLPGVTIVFTTYDEVRSNETYVEVSADCVVSNVNLQYCSLYTLKPDVEELKTIEGCLSKH